MFGCVQRKRVSCRVFGKIFQKLTSQVWVIPFFEAYPDTLEKIQGVSNGVKNGQKQKSKGCGAYNYLKSVRSLVLNCSSLTESDRPKSKFLQNPCGLLD